MKVRVNEGMQRYKLSTPSSSSTAACPTGPPDWPPCRRLRPRHLPSQSLPPSPPLLTFHGLLSLIGNETIRLAHTYVDSGLLYVRTTVLPKLCKERSKSRFVFISLRYSRIGTAAVFFEEDIGVIWPCSVIVIIIHDAIKFLLDAYLHKQE